MPTIVVQAWVESERGWGCRPDGVSLHRSSSDREAFIAAYWATMPDTAPSCYARPGGPPSLMDVDDTVFTSVPSGAPEYGCRRPAPPTASLVFTAQKSRSETSAPVRLVWDADAFTKVPGS